MPFKCTQCGAVENEKRNLTPSGRCDHSDVVPLHGGEPIPDPDPVDVDHPDGPDYPEGYNLRNPDPGVIFRRDADGTLTTRAR